MKGSTRRKTAVVVFTVVSLAAFASKPSTRTMAEAVPSLDRFAQPDRGRQARLVEAYGKAPLSFEANQGQADPRVKFLSRGSGYTLFLTSDEAVISLRGQGSGVGDQGE